MPTPAKPSRTAWDVRKSLTTKIENSRAVARGMEDGPARDSWNGKAIAYRMALTCFDHEANRNLALRLRLLGTLAHFAFEFADPKYPAASAVADARDEVENLINGWID